MDLQVHPLTTERWNDLVALFSENTVARGCYCMWFRQTRSQSQKNFGECNRAALKRIVDSGEIPGLLGYIEGKPVAWVSVAPRAAFSVLNRSSVLKPVDDSPVWSVVCFFTSKPYRRQGVTLAMLEAAVEFARQNGAQIIEGYPLIPKSCKDQVPFLFPGIYDTFIKAGFIEVARRSERHPVMRYTCQS